MDISRSGQALPDYLKQSCIITQSISTANSDNGAPTRFGSNWPLRGGKGTLFEGGIHTVGFIHSELLDDSVKGTSNNALIHVSDWFPTFMGLADPTYSAGDDIDGVDMWDAIKYVPSIPLTFYFPLNFSVILTLFLSDIQ